MRLALLSDIHANLPALKAVWRDMAQYEPDKVLCAGDLVSFGPRPAEVVDFFIEHAIPCVMGNHDAVAAGLADTDSFVFKNEDERRYIKQAEAATMRWLRPDQLPYLKALPEERVCEEASLLLRHSVPDMFVYANETTMNAAMTGQARRFLVVGHSHRSCLYTLDAGKLGIVLPAVGKPKHGDYRAGYCLLDTEGGQMTDIRFRFVDYAVQQVRDEIIERGFPEQTLAFLA